MTSFEFFSKDAKKVNGRIIYLLLRRYCHEKSEVDSQEAHKNWPHLVLEFLEEIISWIRGIGVSESGVENELRNIPEFRVSKLLY